MNNEFILTPVTAATVEKARKLEKKMLERSARNRALAAGIGDVKTQTLSPRSETTSLPYLDRDDDGLVKDGDGEWVMKKNTPVL